MEITKSAPHGIRLLTVSGKLDSNNASEFDSRLREYIEEDSGHPVVLDFSRVQTLTSAPLRAILSLAKRMQRYHSRLFLAAPSENALESLRISGFLKLKIFELTDRLDTALHLAQQAAPAASPPDLAATAPTPLPVSPPAAITLPAPAAPASAPTSSPATRTASPLSAALKSQPPPLEPPPVAATPPKVPLPIAPPPVAPPPVAPPQPVAPTTVAPPAATAPAISALTVAPAAVPPPAVPPESLPGTSAPSPYPAKGTGGLHAWFNRWAWEVQNALDYWVGVFRKKK